MSIEIRSGPASVIASGMVTAFGGHGLTLVLDVDGRPFSLVLGFTSDPEVDGPAVQNEATTDGWRLHLVNFDAPDGRGSAQPVLLGELDHALVFFHFRVFRFGKTEDRTVHFSFYRVAKDAVGWSPVVKPPEGG